MIANFYIIPESIKNDNLTGEFNSKLPGVGSKSISLEKVPVR